MANRWTGLPDRPDTLGGRELRPRSIPIMATIMPSRAVRSSEGGSRVELQIPFGIGLEPAAKWLIVLMVKESGRSGRHEAFLVCRFDPREGVPDENAIV